MQLIEVDPIRDERGWAFREGPDPMCGFEFLSEAYLRTAPSCAGRYTVSCIWDRVTQRLVTNNFPDITIDFETQFTAYHGPSAPDLYPEHLRAEIDAINEIVYEDVNDRINPDRIVPIGPIVDWMAPHDREHLP